MKKPVENYPQLITQMYCGVCIEISAGLMYKSSETLQSMRGKPIRKKKIKINKRVLFAA